MINSLQLDMLDYKTQLPNQAVMQSLAVGNSQLKDEMDEIRDTAAQIEDAVSMRRHVESGTFDCGDSRTWHGRDQDYNYVNVTVNFRFSYNTSAPAVQLSASSSNSERGNSPVGFLLRSILIT